MAWLSGWRKRVKITVDSGDVDSNLAWFPVLIYLSALSGLNSKDVSFVFDELGSNYKRVAVTKSDGITELYVEVEKWDVTNEKAWLWVSRDGWTIASGSDTDLYLYYDNTHADNNAYVGDPNSAPAEKVWDSYFKLVTHMRDDPDTSHVRDSTDQNNDGTKKGANEPQVTTDGQIDDAQDFDGTNDYVRINDDPSLHFGTSTDFTVEYWFKPVTGASGKIVFGSYGGVGKGEYQNYYLNDKIRYKLVDKDANLVQFYSDAILPVGSFYHITMVSDRDGNGSIYINSVFNKSASIAALGDVTTDTVWDIGQLSALYFKGMVDELRISDTARLGAWVKACYETQRDHLLTYGSEETAIVGVGGRLLDRKIIRLERRKPRTQHVNIVVDVRRQTQQTVPIEMLVRRKIEQLMETSISVRRQTSQTVLVETTIPLSADEFFGLAIQLLLLETLDND